MLCFSVVVGDLNVLFIVGVGAPTLICVIVVMGAPNVVFCWGCGGAKNDLCYCGSGGAKRYVLLGLGGRQK